MQTQLTTAEVGRFHKELYAFFVANQRDLPWRRTQDPYHILVSEIMLQQTQVPRVIAKYQEFLKAFSTIKKLAHATPTEVLTVWQGMGYNRRALLLKKCGEIVVKDHKGALPQSYDELLSLPGIGPYTAGAIMAFAFNKPVVMIETNIRTVFIHHFFSECKKFPPLTKGRVRVGSGIHDKDILPLIEQTLDKRNPRKFYSALMDYGTFLKKDHPNPSRRSAHHVKQSRFEGSDRQIRGSVLRLVLREPMTERVLRGAIEVDAERLRGILEKMQGEGIIGKKGRSYGVA